MLKPINYSRLGSFSTEIHHLDAKGDFCPFVWFFRSQVEGLYLKFSLVDKNICKPGKPEELDHCFYNSGLKNRPHNAPDAYKIRL